MERIDSAAKEIEVASKGKAIALPVETIITEQKLLKLAVPPVRIEDRVYLHIRPISEAFDSMVLWNEEEQSITISRPGVIVYAKVGSLDAYVNGNRITLDAAPVFIAGRTLVPLRFIAESLGTDVKWLESTQTIQITGF